MTEGEGGVRMTPAFLWMHRNAISWDGELKTVGDGEEGRFTCTCDAEVALSHPGGVVEKAGDVWAWYSEHRSVPERYSLEILPIARTSFSLLWASLLKNVTTSAAMQDSQKFKHLFHQLGLWITGDLKPLQSGRERMREKLTHKSRHHHWVPVSTELGQQAVVTGHCGTRDYHQLWSRWRQHAWRSHLENDRRFQKSL